MDAILREIELEDTRKEPPSSDFSRDDVSQALHRFIEALREAIPLLEEEEAKEEVQGDESINIDWLLALVSQIPSELDPKQLAQAVWDASHIADEGRKQEALFTALGASEESMNILFQLAPHLPAIQQNISAADIGRVGYESLYAPPEEMIDEAEHRRQKLRQEAFDAAQVAAIAQAEADALMGPSGFGSTHTVARSSDMQAQKMAKKAAKRAAQAMQRARDAGAIIEDSELLAVNDSVLGDGGLLRRSENELRELQESLLPEGSRMHQNDNGLPSGTERFENDEIGYEKVVIPPPNLDEADLHPRLRIHDVMDPDCAIAFDGVNSLNPMQSAVFDTAFNRRENMLVCAPTGAGKTNVAMLALTAHFRDVGLIGSGDDNLLEAGKKVVYIAPMKALAQEVVEKYSSKLKPLGLIVRELTGDMQLTRVEAQSANVLVTTPEKWDVVTRKSGSDEQSLGNSCGLLIIDEVHLLADERGAVIESVVSRLHRLVESRQKQLRIVALSATLPNYEDVAEFLQVPKRGLFFFGPEHRPVPLQQQFVGVFGNIKKRYEIEEKMNDVCYETVRDSLVRGYQVMVFVHSRKGTGDAATALTKRATANEELDRYFITQGKEGSAGDAYKKYVDRVKKSRNREVANHFYTGTGIHHAGMLRGDRKLTESMFADGAIKVLCCTATLAWGINLPAHTVVIKGTDVYNPEKGKNIDLSILDVQQIFGRAGRPQFDSSGEATLITNHAAMTRYLDKLVRAVPIESTFIKQLADHLNAEIVGGTVTNLKEAATWLSYTYLYVRMLRNPLAYGITMDQKSDDPMLRGRCMELVQQAAAYLASNKMVNYHAESGNLGMTNLGRVAAHFYIQAETVCNLNDAMSLRPFPTDSELLRMLASAVEFENVRVRQEEQNELDSLQAKCPLALEGPVNDAATKTFVLIQTFISRERPKSFTLISDTNYVASNAGRVARAVFEMCLNDSKAGTALKLLRLAKSVDNQFWWFQTPLRYFEAELGVNTLKAIESRQVGANRTAYDSYLSTLSLLEMTPAEVGQICRGKSVVGQKIQRFVAMIPRPQITCKVLPVTRDVLRFQIEVSPDFDWHGRWHGGALGFWLWVEDTSSQRIYHHEQIMFTKRTHPESVKLDFPIPIFGDSSIQYIVRVVSDSWVGVEAIYPVSLSETALPTQSTIHTDLMDLTPLPTTALQNDKYEQLFSKIETFNPVQTQLFHVLYHSDVPVFLGSPTGSGKTIVGELAILRMKRLHKNGIAVYIAPLKSLARERLKEWQRRFGKAPLHWKVLELSGDTHHDRRAIETADILVCTPEKWDLISRGWRGVSFDNDSEKKEEKSFVQRVRLLCIDEIHLLGEERGAVLEAIVSRTRFMSQFLRQKNHGDSYQVESDSDIVRIVGLSTAISNPHDLSDWIGVNVHGRGMSRLRGLYNFRPSIRPVPTKIHIQSYPGKHYCPRMATMNKPCYAAIKMHSPDRPTLIFVASRRQTRITALDLISYAAADGNPKSFLGCDEAYIEAIAEGIRDEALKHTITFGIGLHHAGLSSQDRDIVEKGFLGGDLRVLVATSTLAWGVNLPARLVIVKGTEYFDGKSSRYVDYPLTDVLQMVGRAGRPGFDTEGRAVVMVETSKKAFYKKFLYTPFPVESCLLGRICENLNAEIVSSTCKTLFDIVGYLTWTFFARRVKANPSYYGAISSKQEDVEAFLLSIAKESLTLLEKEGCIILDGDMDEVDCEISPTSLGAASSKFYLSYRTPRQMRFGLLECCKLIKEGEAQGSRKEEELSVAWLLYTIACTHEFDELPVRHNEDELNLELSKKVMWGPDVSKVLNPNDRSRNVDSEIFASPHTKCFLLVQAFLETTRLPISDYVNDTKTVMDNIPRLISAMQFIASQEKDTQNMFDIFCHVVKVKQLIESKSTPRKSLVASVLGIPESAVEFLSQRLAPKGSNISTEAVLLQQLRSLPRKEMEQHLKHIPKGKAGNCSTRGILDTLYAIPKVSVISVKVEHSLDKESTKSVGVVMVEIEVDQEANPSRKGRADNVAIAIAIGTAERRLLLGQAEHFVVSSNKKSIIEKKIKFDWDRANAHGGEGGGSILLKVLLDGFRGMDITQSVHLS